MYDISTELRAQANQNPLDADLGMFDVAATEIDRLKARVAELELGAAELVGSKCTQEDKKNLCRILNRSPAQSLAALPARVKVEALRIYAENFYMRYIGEMMDNHDVRRIMLEDADRIEKESGL